MSNSKENKKEIEKQKEIRRIKIYQRETRNIKAEFAKVQKREKEYDEKESDGKEYDFFAFTSFTLASTFGFGISFFIQKIYYLISIGAFITPIVLSGLILLMLFIFYSKESKKYQTPTAKLKTILLVPMLTLWSTILIFNVEVGFHMTMALTVFPLFIAIMALKFCLTKQQNIKDKIFFELYSAIDERAEKHDPEYIRQFKTTKKKSLFQNIKTVIKMK